MRSISPKSSHAVRGDRGAPLVVYRSHRLEPAEWGGEATVPASPVSQGASTTARRRQQGGGRPNLRARARERRSRRVRKLLTVRRGLYERLARATKRRRTVVSQGTWGCRSATGRASRKGFGQECSIILLCEVSCKMADLEILAATAPLPWPYPIVGFARATCRWRPQGRPLDIRRITAGTLSLFCPQT